MPKNILFIGPYRQTDGWGGAAKDYVLSLGKTSHNVACRPIYMAPSIEKEIDQVLVDMENNYFDSQPDIIVQNVLPSLIDYQPNCKNIALFDLETHNLKHTGWPYKINLADEAWVSTIYEKTALEDSGVMIPIKVVGTPIDTSKLTSELSPMDIPEADGKYLFYFIGEYISRKYIQALLVAFHREFHFSEQVALFIKTSKGGFSEQQLFDAVQDECTKLKNNMRLYAEIDSYHEELVATSRFTDDEMIQLHKRGDCFVMPSHGESLCRPVQDAMFIGSDIIVTENAGMDELIANGSKWKVNSVRGTPIIADAPMKYLYTSHETWANLELTSLQKAMREAFESNSESRQERAAINKQHLLDNFSHEASAKKFEEIL
mgnify:CR=1 FL=1